MDEWWWCFLQNGRLTKCVKPYFQQGSMSGIVTIINLQHTANRIWICAEFEIRVCWIKLCWSNNHYTTASQKRPFQYIFKYFFNLFYSTTPFLYPQKHKKPYVFWCFQGVLKMNIGLKWVNFFLCSYDCMSPFVKILRCPYLVLLCLLVGLFWNKSS